MLSPQIDKAFQIQQLLFPREKKKAFRDCSGVQRREQNKNNKVLEVSNLRAFYKLYIIGN